MKNLFVLFIILLSSPIFGQKVYKSNSTESGRVTFTQDKIVLSFKKNTYVLKNVNGVWVDNKGRKFTRYECNNSNGECVTTFVSESLFFYY